LHCQEHPWRAVTRNSSAHAGINLRIFKKAGTGNPPPDGREEGRAQASSYNIFIREGLWWALQDSNLRLPPCEGGTLPLS
jgi:hypothetical protein